jgi:putative ABC transport system permease protein
MLSNYFKIALRNIVRNKTYSFINISGLSLGVACCLLLALYIQDEMSYDQHHQHRDAIYRIVTHFKAEKFNEVMGTASPPIAMVMANEIPEVVTATRMLNPPGVGQNLISYEDESFYEEEGFIADSTLFDVLTYEFIAGNADNALVDANSVVITDRLAKKIFGNESALDKIINISQGGQPVAFKITGVYKDNQKSHNHSNFIISMTSDGWAAYMRSNDAAGEWAGQNFVPSYLRLAEGSSVVDVERKMNEVLVKYGSEDMKALGITKTLSLEPVKDIYLRSVAGKSQRITYIYVIASIAVFILLIACINFMNLSTAKATKRANEIGVRKVMGAFRSSLINQLLGEAMVIVVISIIISAGVVQLALPLFNELTGKTISFGTENLGYFLIALSVITILTGLIAGSYPAFYLSSFKPAEVLKGKSSALSNSSGNLRRALVVFQFMIAITLVCGMIIISEQLDFIQEKDLGFNADAKIVLPLRTGSAKNAYPALQKELANTAAIKHVTGTSTVPGSSVLNDFAIYTAGKNMDLAVLHKVNYVDNNYLQSLEIPLIAGRYFSETRESDVDNKFIVNRKSTEVLGLTPEEAVGQQVSTEWQGEKYTFEIIGVMEDFHQNTLKEEINAMLFRLPSERGYSFLIATLDTKDFKQTISSVEQKWKSLVNDTPFEFSFLDEKITKQYEEDQRVSRVITSFTIIAMLISCLGLYGLSSYMAERRFKEIGVRKVMGASVSQIVGLMSKEFIKLVTVAFVISVPLAWYMMDCWLEGFAYHISVNILVFVYAGAVALAIALLTVSFESIKAATTNPVRSLRNE